MRAISALCNRRMVAVLLTSFASGLPLLLTGSTLQAWYTDANVDLMTIGWLSFVGLPYLFKILWAPLMERYVPLSIGKRKSWIVLTQLAMVVVLLVMSMKDPHQAPDRLAFVAFLLAFFSASQDIVVDAYRTDIALPEERGMAGSLLALGYRVAMLVAGALALVLANVVGWRMTYQTMAMILILVLVAGLFIPRVPNNHARPSSLKEALIEPIRQFLGHGRVISLLVFIVIYKLSDAFALTLNTTFLLRGVGFDLALVGVVTKGVGMVALLLGSLFGGVWFVRLGLYRSLMIFGALQMLSNLLFAWLGFVGQSQVWLVVSVFGDYFCGGLSTMAFVAFLMGLCHHRYSATQYALLSALASVGRVLCGPMAAAMVSHWGWVDFYIMTTVIGVPSLLLLRTLRQPVASLGQVA